MKTALIQTHLHWEDKNKNFRHFNDLLAKVEPDTDLVILPEMFTTGFSMKAEKLAEPLKATTFEFLQKAAQNYDFCITGSYIVKENDKYYNRLLWMNPSAEYHIYDKRHLFTMAGENKHYSPGKQKLIVELNDLKIAPMICYDLRFPVWTRNTDLYDCLIFVANWPESRIKHWNTLLQARAIENQSYVIGVNRIGKDGNGIAHNGCSQVIDPSGSIICKEKDKDCIIYANINKDVLKKNRRHMPFLNDLDNFNIDY